MIDKESGTVFGVVSYSLGERGDKGIAISIETLTDIWSDIPPDFADTIKKSFDSGLTGKKFRENVHRLNTDFSLLVYLVNRQDQKTALNTALMRLKQSGKKQLPHLACVVHGDEYQCIEKFILCLKHDPLPCLRHSNLKHAGIKVIFFGWPISFTNFEELKQKILAGLSIHFRIAGMGGNLAGNISR